MLDIRDIRALDGPNLYDLAPVTLIRYVGWIAAATAFAEQLAQAAAEWNIELGQPTYHEPSALGECAISWRSAFPATVAALAEHLAGVDDAPDINEIGRRMAEERPPASVQQLADQARERAAPILRTDAGWQLGYGSRSWLVGGGAPPWDSIGRIPIVAVTGTNGKTTTTRLIDHTLRSAGWHTGRTDTDGIWENGALLDGGDWTGYGGAVEVLANPRTEIALLETARGGLLRRGLAFDRCDIAVFTNVTEDHLPDRGVSTVAEMAQAKATVVRVATDRVVLNADDPLVVAVAAPLASAPIIWFSLQADSPALAAARAAGGTLLVVRDEELLLQVGAEERRLMAVGDLPLALGGLARHNIANALAAAGALHALGLSDGQIVLGLASFQPNDRDNPGRLNQFQHGGITVIMDYAHNSDGLRVLLHSAAPLRGGAGRLWVIYSGTGDRTDEQINEQGAIIGAMADRFIIKRDPYFLRGRPAGEIEPLLRAAAMQAGMPAEAIVELDGDEETLSHALAAAQPGDVIAFAVHKNRGDQIERLRRWEASSQ
jgi:cyanophycin synthetase